MSTTLAQMALIVKRALGNYTDIDDIINELLNDSQRMLATSLRIREVEAVAQLTYNLAASDPAVYAVPSDFWAPIILYNITSDPPMEVKLKPLEKILSQPALPAQRPFMYGLRAGTIIFRPRPNAAETVEFTYKIKVPDMTSVVDMTLPDEFRTSVEFDAIARGMFINGDDDRAGLFREQRNDELRKIGDQRGEEFVAQITQMELKLLAGETPWQ